MSSDEDQSLSFMCEGSSSVLGMFGESSSGLPGITPSAGESELEDVYDKTSSNPVQLTPSVESVMTPSKEGEHSSEGTSSFSKQESILNISENEIKEVKENQCKSNKENNLQCKANDTIGESVSDSSILDESTKSKEKLVPDKASTELAAEIMEVLGNSKCTTGSESTISKLETCHENEMNNSQSIQEELDSLEQLAMERVREIENEIADSKESVTTKLYCNLPKEIPAVSGSDVDCSNIESVQCVGEESDQKESIHNIKSCDEPDAPAVKLALKSNAEHASESNEDLPSESNVSQGSDSTSTADSSLSAVYSVDTKTNDSNPSSCDVIEYIHEPTSDEVKDFDVKEDDPITFTDENSKTEKIVNVVPSTNIIKTCNLSDDVECSFQSSAIPCSLSNDEKKLSPIDSGSKDCHAQFDDLKNYETDDDDLKVLEAFIVKSATNPEIAICPTKQIEENAVKYSLESTLLDDLTKTDNENESYIEISEKKEELNTQDNMKVLKDSQPVTTEISSSHEQEQIGQEKSAVLENISSRDCKVKTNDNNRRQSKHKTVCCVGKRLPLKKRLSPRKITDFDDCSSIKHEKNEVPMKSIISGIKRGRGRPLGSGKKPKLHQNTARIKLQRDKELENHSSQEENAVRECFVVIEHETNSVNTSTSTVIEEGKVLPPNSRNDCYENTVGSKKNDVNIRKRGRRCLLGVGTSDKKKKKEEMETNYASILDKKGKMERNMKRMFRYVASRNLRHTFVNNAQIVRSSKSRQNRIKTIRAVESTKNQKEERAIENTKLAISNQTSSANIEKLFNVNRDECLIPRITLPIFWCMKLTYELLETKAKDILLPSPLWSVQVNLPKGLVVFLKTVADLSGSSHVSDKAMVFQGNLKPIAFIYNEQVNLPIPSLHSFEDLVLLLQYYNDLPLCVGTGIKQRPCSKYCYKYIDSASAGERCSQCTEERRRVLFCYARKLREKLKILENPEKS